MVATHAIERVTGLELRDFTLLLLKEIGRKPRTHNVLRQLGYYEQGTQRSCFAWVISEFKT